MVPNLLMCGVWEADGMVSYSLWVKFWAFPVYIFPLSSFWIMCFLLLCRLNCNSWVIIDSFIFRATPSPHSFCVKCNKECVMWHKVCYGSEAQYKAMPCEWQCHFNMVHSVWISDTDRLWYYSYLLHAHNCN